MPKPGARRHDGAGDFSRAKTETPSHDAAVRKSPTGATNLLLQSTAENTAKFSSARFYKISPAKKLGNSLRYAIFRLASRARIQLSTTYAHSP
jgi:hypothetical protein